MAHKSTLEMTHEQWMAERQTTIGSSDLGAIIGISGYDTPLDVYQVKKGIKPPFEGNDSTEWGTALEDFCAEMFQRKNPDLFPFDTPKDGAMYRIQRDNKIRVHPTYPWATCNIDRLIVGDGNPIILELKTTTSWSVKKWEDDDMKVPLPYYSQVQWQMYISGYKKAIIWVAVLDTKKFIRLDVEYSQKFIDAAMKEVLVFVDALMTDDPSKLPLLLPDIERLVPTEGTTVEASDEILAKVTLLTELKAKNAEGEKSEKGLAAEIKLFIGTAENLVQGERVIATYKTGHKDAYMVQASDYRSLRLKREKKGKAE